MQHKDAKFTEQGRDVVVTLPSGGDWPEPQLLPDGVPQVQSFDYRLLPASLEPWARDICERVQCAPDFVGVSIMTGLGAVLGRKIGIRPQMKTDWTVTANQWGLVVGRPGVLKSPAMEAALAPLRRLEAKALDAHQSELSKFQLAKKLSEIKASVGEKAARKALDKEFSSDAIALNHLKIEEPTAPILKRYSANNTSAEALGEIHRQNHNGLLVFRDEMVALLKTLDREDNSEARGFYLTGWNGDSPYTFDRIGRGMNLHIPAICLSLLGSTQPGKIADYVHKAVSGGSGDDGLIQRFGLLVWPDQHGEWKNVDRFPDNAAKQEAHQVFERLDALDPMKIGTEQDTDIDGNPSGLPYLRFHPEALELFVEWRFNLEGQLKSGELHPALESHFAKFRKLVPGLALILHLADQGTGPVSVTATMQALAWSEYLESHARRVYASATTHEYTTAKAIIAKIKSGDLPHEFASRDVWRPGWSKLTDRKQVEEALSLLVEFDWLGMEQKETAGRNATIFKANPMGFKQ